MSYSISKLLLIFILSFTYLFNDWFVLFVLFIVFMYCIYCIYVCWMYLVWSWRRVKWWFLPTRKLKGRLENRSQPCCWNNSWWFAEKNGFCSEWSKFSPLSASCSVQYHTIADENGFCSVKSLISILLHSLSFIII